MRVNNWCLKALVLTPVAAVLLTARTGWTVETISADATVSEAPVRTIDSTASPANDGIVINSGITIEVDPNTGDHATILVDSTGNLTGTIQNQGHIQDGILVLGSHSVTSGRAYESTGTATLTGGYTVSGTSTSASDHTFFVGNGTTADAVSVTSTGSMGNTSSGANQNTIHVEGGGDLGSNVNSTAVNVEGTLSSDNGKSIEVADTGDIIGNIEISGTLSGGIEVSGTVSSNDKTINNTGMLSGGINVTSTGEINSSGGNTIHTGGGVTDQISVESGGEILNTAADSSAIFVANTGRVGASAGSTAIDIAGTVSVSDPNADAAITIATGGSILGMIENTNTITGGIDIFGSHSSSGQTYNTTGTLTGGYNVRDGGSVTSTGDDTIYIGSTGSIDTITVESDGEITNTATASNAITVASTGAIGSSSALGATAIDIDGDISADGNDAAISIEAGGNIYGVIDNDGDLTGGISVSGTHSSSLNTINNTGTLTGGITVETGGTISSTGTRTVSTGSTGSTDRITVAGTITNTGTTGAAIYVEDGGALGIDASGTAIAISGTVEATGTTPEAAIKIADGGTLTGSITNTSGTITGGIKIEGIHTGSGKTFDNRGGLTGGYTVESGGRATSTGDDTIYTGTGGTTDKITVELAGQITNTGIGRHAINVDGSSTVGSAANAVAIANDGTISADGGDAAINVNSGSRILGFLDNDRTITGGIDISGTHTSSGKTFDNTGTLTGGYNVLGVGSATSSADDTIYTGATGSTDQVTIASGASITNTGSGSAISVDTDGSLGSTAGNVAIDNRGTVSATLADAAIEVDSGGVITGSIRNTNTITGGVDITGIHTSSVRTFENTGTLTGGYNILTGGHSTSTADHTIYTGASGSTDQITVAGTGQLTNTGTGTSAVYVANGGVVGSAGNAIAIDVDGILSSDGGDAAVSMASGGEITGFIDNSGTITGGVEVAGEHSSTGVTFNNSGTVTGGYTVKNGGLATSSGGDTLYTGGTDSSLDTVTVDSGGTISNTATGSAISVGAGGELGASSDSTAIEVRGTVSATGSDAAIEVGSGGTITGIIDNDFRITSGIDIAGTHTSSGKSFTNTGDLTGGYNVLGSGTATSTGDHTIYTGNTGTTDQVTVASGGTLSSTGSNSSAVYIDNRGVLGINAGSAAITNAGTISADDGDPAISIASGGEIRGGITSTGSITGGVEVSGIHTASGQTYSSSTATGALTGGYVVKNGGLATSTGNHTISIATPSRMDQLVIETGGQLTNSSTGANDTTVLIGGTLGSTAGNTAIQVGGTLSSTNGKAIVVASTGTITGMVDVSGSMSGGIDVSGDHTSSGKTFNNTGNFSGGYSVLSGGDTWSTGDHTLYTGNGGNTDKVSLIGTGTLRNTSATARNSIHVANGGSLGAAADQVAVDIAGTLSSSNGKAIAVEDTGTITGSIVNTGTISNGIEISGTHTGSIKTFDNRGTFTGGYSVLSGGEATSTEDHTVYIGNSGTADAIMVASGGEITNTCTDADAIYIANGGTLGSSSAQGATVIDIAGLLSSLNGKAIGIADTGEVYGIITNSGRITNGIEVTGNHRSSGRSFTNTGTLTGGYTVENSGLASSSGDHTLYTGTGGSTDKVVVNNGGSVTNTGTGSAVYVDDSGSLGVAPDEVAIEVVGTVSATGTDSAIAVASGGTLQGSIENTGNITNGVSIAGTHTSSINTFDNRGTLTGGYDVESDGVVTSSGGHTLFTGNGGDTNQITIASEGQVSNTGPDHDAIFIDNGGDLGATAAPAAIVLDNDGTLSSANGNALSVAGTGIITGIIDNDGVITGGIVISGTHTSSGRSFDNQGSLTGGYTVEDGGHATSTGTTTNTATLYTGDGGTTDKVTVKSGGRVTNTVSGGRGIQVDDGGILGSNPNLVALEVGGIVQTTHASADAAIKVSDGGTIRGSFENSGEITGGVEIAGLLTSSIKSFNNTNSLTGGFTVEATGIVTSTGDDTVYTGGSSSIDKISVVSGGSITNTATDSSAIHIDSGGTVGSSAAVDAIDIDGDLSADGNDPAIKVASGGQILGSLENTGTVDGGVTLSGSHTSSIRTLENTGDLNGGYAVENGGTVSSSGGHTLYTGSTGNIDRITVATGGEVTNTHTGSNAIHVASGGEIGGVANANAIEIGGTVSGGSNESIAIASGGTVTGIVVVQNNGTVANGIINAGTHTAAGDAVRVQTGGTLGDNAAGNAIELSATGVLTSTATNGRAIHIDGGTLVGSIHNEGDISGDIVINGTHTVSGAAYSTEGTSTDRGTLSGAFTVGGSATVSSSTEHTVFTDAYGTTDSVVVRNGGTLANTNSGKSTIFVASNGVLGDTEGETAIQIDGTLSASGANAVSISGGAAGKILIGGSGEVTSGDINIASGGTLAGTIDIKGTVSDSVVIAGAQTSSLDDAIKVDGGLGSDAAAEAIDVSGTVAASGGHAAISVGSAGVLTGIIGNSGTITGDIEVAGTHTSSGKSFNNTGTLSGVFNVLDGGITTSTGDHTIFTGSGNITGKISVSSAGQITNSGTNTNAIHVAGTLGTGAGVSAVEIDGTVVANGGDAAILIANAGQILGRIDNRGTISGGVSVTGTHTSSGNSFNNTGSLTGGYNVNATGVATSSAGNTIYTGTGGTTDKITVLNTGFIRNTGTGGATGSAIFVDSGGRVGAAPGLVAIDIDMGGTVSVTATNTDAAITLTDSGEITGSIESDGTITGGIDVSGLHTSSGKTFNNTGTLTGGYTVQDGGLTTSTGDHTLFTGNTGSTDKITVASDGRLTNTDSGSSAIFVDNGGEVGGTLSATAIEIAGTVSASGADAAISVANGGDITGTVDNTGVITGSIEISGDHRSSDKTFDNSGSLTGGYTIKSGGLVTSSGDDTLYTGDGGTTDKITVELSGDISNTSGGSAIYIDNGGVLGGSVDDVAIDAAGNITGNGTDVAIDVASGGRILGTVSNDGIITGGITVTGSHTATNKAFNNTGSLTVGYTVANGGVVDSSSDHTLYTGDTGNTAKITVALNGQLTNTDNGSSVIFVDGGGTLGSGAAVNAIDVAGAVTASGEDTSIQVAENGTLLGAINNTGVITGGIDIYGLHTSSVQTYTGTGELTGGYNVRNGGTATSTGGHTIVTGTGGALKKITVDAGGQITNSGTNTDAIHVISGGTLGNSVDEAAIEINGAVSSDDGSAIGVAAGGTLMGFIENNGIVTGGVDIAGTHTSSDKTINNLGRITGGINVAPTGEITSTGDHTIYTGNTASIDTVTIVSGGEITNSGTSTSTIFVDNGGNIGSDASANAIDVAGDISADAGSAINIASGGTVTGIIDNTGDISGGISVTGIHTSSGKTFDNTGDISGGYNVQNGGLTTSTGDHTIYTGSTGTTDQVTVAATGQITNTATGRSAIFVTGLTGTNNSGDLGVDADSTAIYNEGIISADDGDVAVDVANFGNILGIINNLGTITGGVEVTGSHSSSRRTFTNTGTLTGGYTVKNTGTVTSTGGHTIYTGTANGQGGTTDKVTVESTGTLSNTGTGSAIFVGDGGTLGSTAGAVAIEIAGTVSATNDDAAISVDNGGTLLGTIDSDGIITGGIEIAGSNTHRASGNLFRNIGQITGGYTVLSGGLATSTNDHAVYTGGTGVTDKVTVGAGGELSTTGTDKSAIFVDNNGDLGDTTDRTLTVVEINGLLSSSNGSAIGVASGGDLFGSVVNTGSISGGISISGTHTSGVKSFNNTGSLTGGYNVESGGLATSTADHTLYTGSGGSTDRVTVAVTGQLTNSGTGNGTGSAIYVDDGGSIGGGATEAAIDNDGTIQSSGTDKAIVAASNSTITGTIDNSNVITGGIDIAGTHTSEARTFTNTGTLTGGYSVLDGGLSTATGHGDHTIYTGDGGITDKVTVADGGEINNTCTDMSAIFVDDGGRVGSALGVDAIDIQGTLSSSFGNAIRVEDGGQILGMVSNSGDISGGIRIEGSHNSSDRAFNNTGTLTGGYTVEDGGLATSTGIETLYTGLNGRTDKVTVEAGGQLTNTHASGNVIHIANGGVLGASVDSAAIDNDGTISVTADNAIDIATDGTLTGRIDNTGTIFGSIEIAGTHTSTGKTFNNTGRLDGSYVINRGTTTSTGDHTIYTGDGGVTDVVVVAGSLTNTGTDKSAIYIDEGGLLGGTLANIAIENLGTISADGGDAAVVINREGSISGRVVNSGTITGGIEVAGTHTSSGKTFENTGTLTGGYTIKEDALVTSTGDDTLVTGSGGNTDKITIEEEGELTNTATGGSAIFVAGTGTVGSSADTVAIENGGLISSTGADAAIEIATDGTILGSINNSGTITGGVKVAGDHTSSGKTFNNTGTLTGGYSVEAGGETTSTGDHTIFTASGASIDKITVKDMGSITNTGTGTNAIYVADGGSLGSTAADTAIDIAGTVSSSGSDAAINIVSGGTVTGSITVGSTGTITGGIEISGTHTSSDNTYNSTGDLTGGITVREGGLLTSTGGHTIFTGNTGSTDRIVIEDNALISNSSTETAKNTIHTGSGGAIGSSSATDATIIDVDGTLSSTNGFAIAVDSGGTMTGVVDNAGMISGGISIAGTHTSSGNTFNNTGRLTGGMTVGGTLTSTGGHTIYTGDDGFTDKVTVASGGTISNTASNSSAIYVADGGNLGTASDQIAIDVEGAISSTGGGAAITIASGGTLTGVIRNEGSITGGIEIYGTHISASKAYTGSGNLVGDYTVMTGGVSESTGDHTIYTGGGVRTNNISVAEGAQIRNSGDGFSAIYVDAGGTLGSGAGADAVNINGAISSTGDDAAIHVVNTGTIEGIINNTGTINGGIVIEGSHTSSGRSFNNTGNLVGGYTVGSTGTVTSTGGHTIYTGDGGTADSVVVSSSGSITNTGTGTSAIYVADGGTLGTDSSTTAIDVAGTVSASGTDASINIAQGGTLSGSIDVTSGGSIANGIEISGTHTATDNTIHVTTGGALGSVATANAVTVNSSGILSATDTNGNAINIDGGAITGTIRNQGDINGNVVINGTQTVTGAAYHASGTSNDQATLTGAFRAGSDATISSSTEHTILTGDHAYTDQIIVDDGASLANTHANKNAIYIASEGRLGNAENQTAIQIDGSVTVASTATDAIGIAGKTTGKILVGAEGDISNGNIDIASGGELTGTIDIQGNVADNITISGSHDASLDDAIKVSGQLGAAANGNAIAVAASGTLSAGNGHAAINIDGGTLTGTIHNQGDITGDVIVNGTQNVTGSAYHTMGTSTDQATLTGSFTIGENADVSSSTSHTVFTDEYAATGKVTVDAGGTLGNSNTSFSTIFVDADGQLGSTENQTAIQVDGILSSSGSSVINIEGNATGKFLVGSTGRVSSGNINIASGASYTGSLDIQGIVSDRVVLTGAHSSTLDDAIKVSGQLGHDASLNAIDIAAAGTLSANNGNAAININGGTVTGSINNLGSVTGDIVIGGTQTASGNAYLGTGASSSLDGTYRITDGGVVSSSTDHAVLIGASASIGSIDIGSGGSLSSEAEARDAIRLVETGQIGDGATETTDVIRVAGSVSANKGIAINVDSDLTGRIVVDVGGGP